MKKYKVYLVKEIELDCQVVEAKNKAEAEKKAYPLFNKYDRDDSFTRMEAHEEDDWEDEDE